MFSPGSPYLAYKLAAAALFCACLLHPAFAQQAATAPIVFTPGTGNGGVPTALPYPPKPVRATIACDDLINGITALSLRYQGQPVRLVTPALADAAAPQLPPNRLDRTLLRSALASFSQNHCHGAANSGPAQIIVVDFAKRSNEPRLYRIDLITGDGIDTPVLVAHGRGSDPNDDGYADAFGNVQNSLMSSLGAVRGAEVYLGRNGRALRLDGLDTSNNAMRARDIVVHSYQGDARRYFNAGRMAERGNTPGVSEGCFVIEPNKRDWLIDSLSDGGFLFAGLAGKPVFVEDMTGPIVTPQGATVVFKSGTGG